jgi:chitosanase
MYNNCCCQCCFSENYGPNYYFEYYQDIVQTVLRKGQKGKNIKILQERLNYYGARLIADGEFGNRTEIAVKIFQKNNNLDADGIVGPKTASYLNNNNSKRIDQIVTISPSLPSFPKPNYPDLQPGEEITKNQRKVIDTILSINETGKIPSNKSYSTVGVLADGAGISYGKHQGTDNSGSLDKIVKRYKKLSGSTKFDQYIPKLESNFSTKYTSRGNASEEVKNLVNLLEQTGSDPLMQRAQDEVFDEGYWRPIVEKAKKLGLKLPFSYLVFYDTCINAGCGRLEQLIDRVKITPPIRGGNEKEWIQGFLTARYDWLIRLNTKFSKISAEKRVGALRKIANENNWFLQTPFQYRGFTIEGNEGNGINDYSSTKNENVTQTIYPIQANNLTISQKLLNSNNKTIFIIGDSQVGRSIKKGAETVLAPYYNARIESWYKEGTTPKKIMEDHILNNSVLGQELKRYLSQRYPVIIIQLGDNGISSEKECFDLLNYINSYYYSYSLSELPYIIWSGPFPLCLKDGQSTSYVKSEPCSSSEWRCITNYQKSKKNTFSHRIEEASKKFNNVKFISPYNYEPFRSLLGTNTCWTSDGVHVIQNYTNSYLQNFKNI